MDFLVSIVYLLILSSKTKIPTPLRSLCPQYARKYSMIYYLACSCSKCIKHMIQVFKFGIAKMFRLTLKFSIFTITFFYVSSPNFSALFLDFTVVSVALSASLTLGLPIYFYRIYHLNPQLPLTFRLLAP